MILKALNNSAEWRSMWNNDVLPYLRRLRPVAGHGIRIDYLATGCVISVTNRGEEGAHSAPADDGSYNSYFKLSLSSTTANDTTTWTARIADGATDGKNIAVVNGYNVYQIDPYTEAISADRLFYAIYTPATYTNQGAVDTPASMSIGSVGATGGNSLSLPTMTQNGPCYYQIGRVLFSGGVPKIQQDFTGGVLDARWYVSCYA